MADTTIYRSLGTVNDLIEGFSWPVDFVLPENLQDFLDNIYVIDYAATQVPGGTKATIWLAFEGERSLALPGLDGVRLVALGGDVEGLSFVTAALEFGERMAFSLENLRFSLRFDDSILKPAAFKEGDPVAAFAEISIEGSISIDSNFDISVQGFDAFRLAPAMIGSTGVIIAAEDVKLDLSRTSAIPEVIASGFDEGFMGVYIGQAQVKLPEGLPALAPEDLVLTRAAIGSGGVSGRLEAGYSPTFDEAGKTFNGRGAGALFGIPFGLEEVAIELKQNALVEAGMRGQMLLPFFDEPVAVGIGINADGSFAVGLTGAGAGGLATLTKAGVLRLDLESIGFEYTGGIFIVKLSGQVKPLFGGLDWPTFQVKELSIDSNGNVRFDGGWIDLRDQYSLDFHGFKLEITKLGFGKTDDGTGKWIGFSGALKLVDGMSAGASVEGLRLSWYDDGDIAISLDGVGVELDIPGVLRLKGSVSYRELPGDIHRFDGDIALDLVSLDMRVDAQLVIGTAGTGAGRYSFMAIYLGLELPAGLPLGATGLALYGMAGLFALEMEPDKRPAEAWFENDDASPGWYRRPAEGVSDLSAKWRPAEGSLALGAGVTLGTLADNGYTFSGKLLLVVVFPGPVLLIEGRANLLKERAKLGEEAMFRALAILDGREGSLLLNLAAQYKYGGNAELIDIRASAEAFFDFSDANAWHLYLGEKEPRERRIRAEIFRLFEANSYFMLDARQLAMGAWLGYDKSWKFGPLRVTVEAWIEGNVILSWKPAYLYGDLWLHGEAGLKVFGFGLTLGVDAKFAAGVFDPFHLLASFSVKIGLPWPLSDIKKTIELEWGPEGDVPALPMPLKEIAVEHFKTTVSWPLPRAAVLRPDWDPDGDGYVNEGAVTAADLAALETALPPAGVPVVPLDCRPHITFGRAVHDRPLVGTNVNFIDPPRERIGDPARNEGPLEVEYALRGIELHKLAAGAWSLVARRSDAAPATGDLYGSWAPVAGAGGGGIAQVKLWLWSKSAFDYTRHSGGAWDEWFTDQFGDYPCVARPPDRVICCDLESVAADRVLRPPWKCPGHDKLTISWEYPPQAKVTVLAPAFRTFRHALCVPAMIPGGAAGPQPNSVFIGLPEPAESVRILIAEPEGEGDRVETCVDFSGHPGSRSANARTEEGVVFEVRDAAGERSPGTTVDTREGMPGLDCGRMLDVSLPAAAPYVDLTVSLFSPAATISAFNADTSFAGLAQVRRTRGDRPQTLRLTGRSITQVRIGAPENGMLLHKLCYGNAGAADGPPPVTGTGFTTDGQVIGPVAPVAGVIEIDGPGLARVLLRGPACIVQVCVNIGPDPAHVKLQQEMAQHLSDETARWSRQGDVLEPHTDYRLKVVTHIAASGIASKDIDLTEFAYFRTEGPPGLAALSTPAGQDAARFDSGLNDLARYVAYTVPSTVPAAGEKPPLPRPVYRAYDVGVAFNENYVDLMYRIAGRDLGLYLYDNNNRPVRDAGGGLVGIRNRWGVTEDLTLTESENDWITTVNGSDCAVIDRTLIPHANTLGAAEEGLVLGADTLQEARLVPLLLHEAFAAYQVGAAATGTGASLGRWTVVDQGANGAPSHWEVGEEGTPPGRYVIQMSNIWGGTLDANDPVKPGTLLVYADTPLLSPHHPEQPSNWTDYRMSVTLRSGNDNALGVLVRYTGPGHHYRFAMDRERRVRRLLKVYNGVTTVLAADEFTYTRERDYLVTVEALGASLRIYQDGELVFDTSDGALADGTVGLYCWANSGARFADVRVDDFSLAAPVVYRFQLTTSRFTNFFHHLHSYRDETWRTTVAGASEVAAAVGAAVEPTAPPSALEERAFEQIAVLSGVGTQPAAAEVQVTRLELVEPFALLVRNPEPIAWSRTTLELLRQTRPPGAAAVAPGRAKLTDVSFALADPNEESVTVLLQEAGDTEGWRIDYRAFPGALAPVGSGKVLFADRFDTTAGLLLREDFGPNALDHYTIVDEGTTSSPSAWSVLAGAIVQTSNISGGSSAGAAPEKPGTLAIVEAGAGWTNVRVRATFRSSGDDAIGLVFRYVDRDNYYRVSFDRERSYRRLVKKVGGVVAVLWEDGGGYDTGRSYELAIEVFGDHLVGHLDGVPVFNVRDADLARGSAGFYCWANPGARFEALEVDSLGADPVLWESAFTGLDQVGIVDAGDAVGGPSLWEASGGTLRQTSDINEPGAGVDFAGTYAYAGDPAWRDVQVYARLRSDDDDAIGLMFRYVDDDNYYRFSMDSERGYRRLIKKVGGVVHTLWQDAVAYTVGRSYDLTIRASGTELSAYLDGAPLFTVHDAGLRAGRIAFYCWSNTAAYFERALVTDATRRVGEWIVTDEGSAAGPSAWLVGGGALVQRSGIGDQASPDYPGTFVLLRGRSWTDLRLSVTVRADASGAVGVMFRCADEDNYYRLSLDNQHNQRRLVRKTAGATTILFDAPGSYAIGAETVLTIDAIGAHLVGYVGSERLFDLVDTAHPGGRVGLYCWRNGGARFDAVEVRVPPVEAHALMSDRFAEGDTGAWTFVDEGTVNGPSAWSTVDGALRQTSNIYAPPVDRDTLAKRGTQALAGDPAWLDLVVGARLQSFDVGAIGFLFRYVDNANFYRFSMDSLRGYRRLVKAVAGVFTLLWEDEVAYEPGRPYELTLLLAGSTLRGHLDGIPLFVVEDADVPAGRIGLYCWANTDARFSRVHVYPARMAFDAWLLDESFDALAPATWTFVDDGTVDAPSDWHLDAGSLRQEGGIRDGDLSPTAPEKVGTFAVAGSPSWTDYRVEVRLASSGDGAIGVMFRHADPDNYYRLSMDALRGYRRLIRKAGGIVAVLWEANASYVAGREYLMTVECARGRLSGYLDGVLLFALDDSYLAGGGIALYSWGKVDARFAEVRVAPMTWETWHAFAGEEVLPAGTRVQVLSGNEAEAPPPTAQSGLVRRFVATLADRGTIRLPASGADLRLVAGSDAVVHARAFLPEAEYQAIGNVRVLRKADGTDFIVMVPSPAAPGSHLESADYRLRLTYRRDNRVLEPDSAVFSQAGDSTDEVVTLDVPWRSH